MNKDIDKAVSVLSRDGLVVYPTETVYGLGADALSDAAVHRVYEVKKRPLGKPVSVAVSDMEMLGAIAAPDEAAWSFIEAFLPGPVTVVVPAKSCLPPVLTGGTGDIGIRMPDHPVALELIAAFDAPITATSANLAGRPSPTTREEVTVVYDFMIDVGGLPGTPSTVVDLTTRQILRPGADLEQIAQFLRDME